MSYAIIRNERYTSSNLGLLYRHNERKNTNYSNKDINRQNSIKNYSLKQCNTTYLNRFNQLKEQYDLKGQIKKTSNIVCEYIITSDKDFFDSIGDDETKRYFETAFKFVANYKKLGEEFIISAKIHMDEQTPHMHLVFIPVIHIIDSKSGKSISKVACSEFWKGKNSYKYLQDNFYSYMTKAGFELERGKEDKERSHILTKDYKEIVNYEVKEMFEETKHLEQEVITNDFNIMKDNYKRVIRKFNTLAKRYIRIKNIVEDTIKENENLQRNNQYLEQENNKLSDFLEKTYDYVSLLFDFPKERLKKLVKNFVDKMKGEE